MTKLLERLPVLLMLVLATLYTALLLFAVDAAYDAGALHGNSQGDTRVSALRIEQEQLRAAAAEEALQRLQVEQQRVLTADAELLKVRAELVNKNQQLTRERIAHVSKQTTADGAGLITCGWLREYNSALGASLQAPAACAVDPHAETTTWQTTGSDAELQPAGVSLADVLAHARDYGQWAQAASAHLNQLLDLLDKEHP